MPNRMKFGRTVDIDAYEWRTDRAKAEQKIEVELQRLSVNVLRTIIDKFRGAAFVEVSWAEVPTFMDVHKSRMHIEMNISHHPAQPISIVDMGLHPSLDDIVGDIPPIKCGSCGRISEDPHNCSSCGAPLERR